MVPAFAPSHDDDRRAQPRLPLPPGMFAYLSPHRLIIARAGDVSASGAFLSTAFPDPVGTRAAVDFELDGERIQLAVEVVRTSFFGGKDGTGAGMGVVFLDVSRDVKRRLMGDG